MDVLFLEEVEFKVEHTVFLRARVAPSREEVLRFLMANVGIELVDYHSFTVQPCMPPGWNPKAGGWDRQPVDLSETWDVVKAYSRAFRERTERDAAHR